MVTDIEQEYSNYVSNIWQDISKHSLQHHWQTKQLYDAISVASIQFLQKKLKALEQEKPPSSTG